jgi:phosphoribosylglycinamide formyltransferase-1
MKSLVILISGRGSNMRAIVDAVRSQSWPARVAAIISNRAEADGLAWAGARGIAGEVVEHRDFPTREAFDAALAQVIDRHAPDAIALAGFMRILTDGFVRRYEGRLVNIHPSLLPAFPGLHTHRHALEQGVKIHGCTAHFVTSRLDHGPIIAQAAVPVLAGDDEHALAERVLAQEHRIYPKALRWLLEGRLVVEAGVVRVKGAGASEDSYAQSNLAAAKGEWA